MQQMLKKELSKQIGLSIPDLNQLLIKLNREDLVAGNRIPTDVAQIIIKGFEQATAETKHQDTSTEPEQNQPSQPAPGMGGALAETQTEQLQESRQKIEAVLPKIDQILIQQIAQSAIADADLQSITYRAVFEARNLDNQLAIAQEKIGQLKARNKTALEQFDPYQIMKDLGLANPQQIFEALCEYERGLSQPSNTQSVDVNSLGKQNFQEKLEALKLAFRSN